MDVEIRVDRVRCIGSGQCVHVAPGVFDQDERAISVVVDPRGEPEEKIVHAVTACPVEAITLHVGGASVGAGDLKDWAHGARSDDPVVALLARLCDDHHDLRAALTGTLSSGDEVARVDEIVARTREHLRAEEEAYAAITALVDRRLVDAFEDDHGRIDDALDRLGRHPSDAGERERAFDALARTVDTHIRLEETVLFPLALAALARGRSGQPVTAP